MEYISLTRISAKKRNISPWAEFTCKTFSKNFFKAYKKKDDALESQQSSY